MKALVTKSSDPNGKTIAINITKMTGRVYADLTDTVGKPDNRYQVYGDVEHKVYEDKEAIKKDFILSGAQSHDVMTFFQ